MTLIIKNYNYRCNFRHRSWIGRSLFSRRLSYRHYRSQRKSIRRGMRPGQRQTILSSVRHHRYTSYHSSLETLTQKMGGMDILIICAGTGELNPELSYQLEESTLLTNVIGSPTSQTGVSDISNSKKAGIWLLFPLLEVRTAVASLPPTTRRKPIKSTIWKDYDRKQLNLLILFTLPIFVPDL